MIWKYFEFQKRSYTKTENLIYGSHWTERTDRRTPRDEGYKSLNVMPVIGQFPAIRVWKEIFPKLRNLSWRKKNPRKMLQNICERTIHGNDIQGR